MSPRRAVQHPPLRNRTKSPVMGAAGRRGQGQPTFYTTPGSPSPPIRPFPLLSVNLSTGIHFPIFPSKIWQEKLRHKHWAPHQEDTERDNGEKIIGLLRRGSAGACAETRDCPKGDPTGSENPQGNFACGFWGIGVILQSSSQRALWEVAVMEEQPVLKQPMGLKKQLGFCRPSKGGQSQEHNRLFSITAAGLLKILLLLDVLPRLILLCERAPLSKAER